MPARVPNASGNWSDASNWLTASNTVTLHASTNVAVNTTNRYTATFTAPSTSASCVGVAVYIATRTASQAFTIALQENSVDVASRTFTAADVPLNCEGWYFFRLTTPYQYTNTTAGYYRFRIVTDTASTTTNLLRTDSGGSLYAFVAVDNRTGVVAGTDDVFVLADVAGSTKTITFNQNDSGTSCLSAQVGYNATFTFNTNMTTQMIIGDGLSSSSLVRVFAGGNWLIGTIANPVPAQYTATLVLNGSVTTTSNPGVGTNSFSFYSGTNGSPAAFLSFVGDPSFNASAITVDGYATGRYMTTLANQANSGTNTLVLSDDLGLRPSGGDLLGLADSYSTLVTTSAYNPSTKTVTLTANLANTHIANKTVNNLTRNVTIKATTLTKQFRIDGIGTNTVVLTPPVFRHCSFDNALYIQASGGYYGLMHQLTVIGAAVLSRAFSNVWSNGFANLSNFQLINCHFGFSAMTASTNSYTVTGTTTKNLISNCSVNTTAAAPWYAITGRNVDVKNCRFGGSSWITGSEIIASNCVGDTCVSMIGNGREVDLINCRTYFYAQPMLSSAISCRVINFTYDYPNNGPAEIIDAGCSNNLFVNYVGKKPYSSFLGNNGANNQVVPTTNGQYHIVSVQSSAIETYPANFSQHFSGRITRYISSTVPQSVFPLPSGAQVANRVESLFNSIETWPMIQVYRIPVPAGAQSNTVTIPVYLNGWGSSLPSNTELYVTLTGPGLTTTPASTTTVTANDQWQYLTVSGVTTMQGHLIVKVVLKKYVANAVMYVDWPLGMSTTNLDWYEGRPNEYLTPLTSYTAGQDLKSLRIDGPGMQEFKIPVASRLTTLTIKARYDSAHGTTAKPRALILAQPNLGISQQTATMTAGADTWETLTLRCTPAQAGTITLRLESRAASPWGRAWFDSFTAE